MALQGIKVLELAGLAPVPFCGMLLADFGASVVRVDRTPSGRPSLLQEDTLARGKRSIAVDLKAPAGQQLVLKLMKEADVVVEPFRPGVMESLGLGPEAALKANPRLIYARLTGFGQTGPYAPMAGHDINYVAMSGMLAAFGRKEDKPIFPGNLLADFAGGGLMCAFGILAALLERAKSGKGQVIDAAMADGALYIGTFLYKGMRNMWGQPRGENMLDSGAPFYEVYETKDGQYMAVGALEPQFYKLFMEKIGLGGKAMPAQFDNSGYPEMKQKLTQVFKSKTRAEWEAVFDGSDACVTPVLHPRELLHHSHTKARNVVIPSQNATTGTPIDTHEPAPAPKLSRTPGFTTVRASPTVGQHTMEVLREFHIPQGDIDALLQSRVIYSAPQSKL